MRFVAARPALAQAVKVASAAAGGSLPICNGVRFDVNGPEVAITCTNLDLTIRATVAIVDGTAGSAVVPAIFLSRFLSATDGGTATLTLDDNRLLVESGEASITLYTLDVDEWPAVAVAEGTAVALSPAVVSDLRKLAGYADHNPKATVQFLRGVHFAGRIAEASDKYRYGRVDVDVELPGSAIVPVDALESVLRNASGTVTYVADDRRATFASGNVEWTTSVIEADFPNCDKFIQETNVHAITLDVARLDEAVKRCRILSDGDDSEGIIVTVDGGKAFLRNRETERGEIVDVVPCEGELPWPLLFRGKFLADLVANAEEATITVGTDEVKTKPLQVNSDRLTQVVMPVIVPVAPK